MAKSKKKSATPEQIEAYYTALKDSSQSLRGDAEDLGMFDTNGNRKNFDELKVPGKAFVLLRAKHPDIRVGKNYGSYLRTLSRGKIADTKVDLLSYLKEASLSKASHALLRLFWDATRSRNGHWEGEANRIMALLKVKRPKRPRVASEQLGLAFTAAAARHTRRNRRVNSITQATTVAAPAAVVVTRVTPAVVTEQVTSVARPAMEEAMLAYVKARAMGVDAIAKEGQDFINKLAVYNGFWSSLPTKSAVIQFQAFPLRIQAEAIVVFETGKGLR